MHTQSFLTSLAIISLISSTEVLRMVAASHEEFTKFSQDCKNTGCIGTVDKFAELLKSGECNTGIGSCVAVAKVRRIPETVDKDKIKIYAVDLVFQPMNSKTTPPTEIKYLAFGICEEQKMGPSMLVIECVVDNTGKAFSYVSWVDNLRARPLRLKDSDHPISKNASTLAQGPPHDHSTYSNPHRICTFELPSNFTIQGKEFNLKEKKYFVNIASGAVTGTDNRIGRHIGTVYTHQLQKDFNVKLFDNENRSYGKEVHGMLVSIAYMFIIPMGTVVARFFRESWSEYRLPFFKKRIWFPIHVVLMNTGFVFALGGYIAIVYEIGPWPNEHADNGTITHAIVGTISFLLFFIQVALPWIFNNLSFNTSRYYYMLHAALGGLTYILGIMNITMSSFWVHFPGGNLESFYGCVWVAFHIAFYITFSTLMILTDPEMEISGDNFRAFKFPMKVRSSSDAPGVKVRTLILIGMLVISFLLTLLTCVHIWSLE